MPKIDGFGQARIFTGPEYGKFRAEVKNPKHRLMFDVAWWTGERMGAICQLTAGNVYAVPIKSEPRDHILYPADTRKDGKTRECRIHPELAVQLRMYEPPLDGWLFPRLRHPEQHMSRRDADAVLRYNLVKLGWQDRGFSTHSFRRSFITRLHERGCDPVLIQKLTGHASLSSVQRYIEVAPERLERALLLL